VYTIERKDGKIIVRNEVTSKLVYSSSDDGYVIYNNGDRTEVSKVKDLNDVQLLRALSASIPLAEK